MEKTNIGFYKNKEEEKHTHTHTHKKKHTELTGTKRNIQHRKSRLKLLERSSCSPSLNKNKSLNCYKETFSLRY